MRPGPVRADAPTRPSLIGGVKLQSAVLVDDAWRGRRRRLSRSEDRGWRLRGNVHLCGHRFQPIRDPSRFPVCPKCKELAAMLWGPE
jgi:Protein of unknown function (DUF3039)